MPKTCILTVNGTLLNLAGLDSFFEAGFKRSGVRELWFQTVMHTAASLSLHGRFVPFETIGMRTLYSLAEEAGIEFAESSTEDFLFKLRSLPVYSDVRPALGLLRDAGYGLVALTNSGKAAATEPLSRAGVLDFFDDIISAEAVEAYKPSLDAYLHVAEKLKRVPKQLWFITGHAWDTMGARQAGFKTALLFRPHHGLNENFPKPDVAAEDLVALTNAIQRRDRLLLQQIFGEGMPGSALM